MQALALCLCEPAEGREGAATLREKPLRLCVLGRPGVWAFSGAEGGVLEREHQRAAALLMRTLAPSLAKRLQL